MVLLFPEPAMTTMNIILIFHEKIYISGTHKKSRRDLSICMEGFLKSGIK